MKIIILSALLLSFPASFSYAVEKKYFEAAGIQAMNQKAPDFELLASDGKRVRLEDFKGKIVLLHFWATWCRPCKEELPLLEKLYQGMEDKNIVFFGHIH